MFIYLCLKLTTLIIRLTRTGTRPACAVWHPALPESVRRSRELLKMSVEVKHWSSQGNLYDMWVQGAYTFVPEQSMLLEVWDTVMLVALSCTTFLLPIECTLMTELPPWAQQANAILDGIFCVDILMNFNIAYNRSDHLSTAWERSPVKIAGRYTAFPLSEGQEASCTVFFAFQQPTYQQIAKTNIFSCMVCVLLNHIIYSMEAGWFWLDVATILPYDRLPALFMGSKSARFALGRGGI